MKQFKIMRKTAEVINDNGMSVFKGDVIDIDDFENKTMPIFIKDSEVIE